MRHQNHIALQERSSHKRGRLTWQKFVLQTLLITLVTGIIAHMLFDDDGSPLNSIFIAGCYTTAFMTVSKIRLEKTNVSLSSKKAVARHVLIMTLLSIACLIGVTIILDLVGVFPAFSWLSREFFLITVLSLGTVALVSSFYYMNRFYRNSMENDRKRLTSEIKALKAQINPHFLFNSLNTIVALIRTKPDLAEQVTEDLAELFRFSLRSGDRPLVALQEELEIVEMYLNIERARFGNRLTAEFDIPEKLKTVIIPSLLLQPLVENAVKHGVSRVEGICRIWITLCERGSQVEIKILDDGPGFSHKDKSKLYESGYGLQNVETRLQLTMGRSSTLEILDQGVLIRFPMQKDDEAAGKPAMGARHHSNKTHNQ